MTLKSTFLIILMILSITGCSIDNSTNEISATKKIIGNKYAHLMFETREECETFNESYFMNCAQVLEVINENEVNIYVTDILYTTEFYVENNILIIKSSPDTYEFSEDLIFKMLDNGDLKLGENIWIKFDEDYYE